MKIFSKKVSLIFLAVVVTLIVAALFLLPWHGNITEQEAHVICKGLADKASAQVAALPDYSVSDKREVCAIEADELGSNDYIGGINFLLAKASSDNQKTVITREDVEGLRDKLQPVQAGWSLRNIIDANGQSYLICASSGAYIDNDGSFYSQGNTSNYASFYATKTDPGYSDECL